jgi:hypothetical protein
MDDERHRWKWRLLGLGGGVLFSAVVWIALIYWIFNH